MSTGFSQAPGSPSEELARLAALLPAKPQGVGRPMDDREAWASAGHWPTIRGLAKDAERFLQVPVPELGAAQWSAFSKTGDRQPFEGPARERTTRLIAFVVAEGLEDHGRFRTAIEREMAAILDEPAWVMAPTAESNPPVASRTVIDLATAARVWTLATADHWMGERLAPELRRRLREEMRERVFDPYLSADAYERFDWFGTKSSNWMAVCHAGVVGAALAIVEAPEDRARFVQTALACMPRYLNGERISEKEGHCREGVSYWNYGFGNYLLLAEALWQNSKGKINLYEGPRPRQIALAVRGLELSHGTYPAFGDSGWYSRPNTALLWLINRRFGLDEGAWPATPDDEYPFLRPEWAFEEEPDRPDTKELAAKMFGLHPLGDRLAAYGIFAFPSAPGSVAAPPGEAPPATARDLRCWLRSPQIAVFRDFQRGKPILALALKGGHNAEPHGHFDNGSYIVSVDGWPLLLDPGPEQYTRTSFGSGRYDSMMNNSLGHPVPVVAGKQQTKGEKARAEVVSTEFNDLREVIVLDLTACYSEPELESLWRSFFFDRTTRRIEIIDEAKFKTPQVLGTAFVTNSQWSEMGSGGLRIDDGGYALEIRTTSPQGPLQFQPDPVTAPKLYRGVAPVRLGYNLQQPAAQVEIRSVIEPADCEENSAMGR